MKLRFGLWALAMQATKISNLSLRLSFSIYRWWSPP